LRPKRAKRPTNRSAVAKPTALATNIVLNIAAPLESHPTKPQVLVIENLKWVGWLMRKAGTKPHRGALTFMKMTWRLRSRLKPVGWVERSETHHPMRRGSDGFRYEVNPSYELRGA
jgi:hypothetical protein